MNSHQKALFLKRLQQEMGRMSLAPSSLHTQALKKLDIESQLFIAILVGEVSVIEQLLKKGADPNATNKKGTTLLQLALAFKREEVAALLYQYGAVPSFHSPSFKKK